MKRGLYILEVVMVAALLAGCSYTVYERKKDGKKPLDQGVESKLTLEGPTAAVETVF